MRYSLSSIGLLILAIIVIVSGGMYYFSIPKKVGEQRICQYNNQTYSVGNSFGSIDGCNTCKCSEDGNVICTEIACVNTNAPSTTTPVTGITPIKAAPLLIKNPNGGEVLSLGSKETIRWTGGKSNLPTSISLISDSANYRCKRAGGDICPQDMSFIVVIRNNLSNTGSYTWNIDPAIPTNTTDTDGQYGKYWLQICQGQACDLSDEVITLRK